MSQLIDHPNSGLITSVQTVPTSIGLITIVELHCQSEDITALILDAEITASLINADLEDRIWFHFSDEPASVKNETSNKVTQLPVIVHLQHYLH